MLSAAMFEVQTWHGSWCSRAGGGARRAVGAPQLETSGVRRRARQHTRRDALRAGGTVRRCESVCGGARGEAQRPRRQCGIATWLCAAEEAHGMLWKDVGRLGES
eukprot:scaffold68006_cov51-Phaeocystis_antarctica.AAC.3